MSRYDFAVRLAYDLPEGCQAWTDLSVYVTAESELEARRIIIHDGAAKGGWIKSIQRIQTPIPPQAGE